MSSRSRAMTLVKFLLPPSALLLLALSIFLGIALAQPAGQGAAQIVMVPPTTGVPTTPQTPQVMPPGSTGDFIVRVLTPGVDMTAVQISMTFDAQFLEVVDANPGPFAPGVQIEPILDSPFHPLIPGSFTLDNTADNVNGTIRYTVGNATPTSGDFALARIIFRAKGPPTPVGFPTQVIFLVTGGNDTQVSKSGELLLMNTTDFTGAFISIPGGDQRVAQIVMVPTTSQAAPETMASGSTTDFTVRVLPNGTEVTAVQLSMTFDTRFLEVVDSLPQTGGVQILPHPTSPFPGFADGFTLENIADNINGTIRYTVGSATLTSGDFDLATISFRAKAGPTTADSPTEVVFRVSDGDDTAVSKSGQQLLINTSDFTGAFIEVTQVPEGPIEIVMLPATTRETPQVFTPGLTVPFTVRVLGPAGVEVTAVQLSMTFDPQFLEVVDASPFAPGAQIEPILDPNSPFHPTIPGSFTLDNTADNVNGTIRYTVGNATPTSGDFDLARINFRAKGPGTPAGFPTKVVFLVFSGDETQVSKSGQLLLKNTQPFTGAFIEVAEVPEGQVEIVMLGADTRVPTTGGTPQVMPSGSTADFIVRVLTPGVEITAVQLSMTFAPQFLEVTPGGCQPLRPWGPDRAHPRRQQPISSNYPRQLHLGQHGRQR